ncbi:MAG: mucoidy inhibitor MuiA family protein [Chitinophagaceae bacterium]
MRRGILVLLIIVSCISSFSQKENQAVSSKIEKVTVFLQGAQVERTAKQNLNAGKYNIVFNGISPKVDKQSIQLKAEGKLTVLSVTHQVNYLNEQQAQDEIKQLETQKEQWLEKISLEKNMKNVYSQEEKMIIANQSIKGDATLKATELKEAADFQRQRLTEIYQKLQENDRNIKKMDIELQKIDKQLSALHQKKDLSTSEVIVAVDVKEAMTANFRLNYLVKQSSWFPTYDIRVQDISQPINLQMKANIKQESGEDWKDVKLFLSTGNPNENGTKPTLSPWYLRYYYPVVTSPIRIRGASSLYGSTSGVNITNLISGTVRTDKGEPVAGATVIVKGSSIGVTTDAIGNFSTVMPSGSNTLVVSYVGFAAQELNITSGYANVVLKSDAASLSEVVVVGYGSTRDQSDNYNESDKYNKRKKEETAVTTTTVYQPTTTIFEIQNPYTVANDGKTYTVDINSYELNALYEYYSAPKLDASAYLTAKIIDWQELNLLPGEANLFFEGTFLGNSLLDVLNAGDTLNLSLGKDKGVVIKRTLMKEYSAKKFLGSNKTDSRQYEISIRNNKQLPIKIILEDQFPISTNKDIEVDKFSYENGKLDDDTKKVTWNLSVDAKKENKLQMSYVVKYPKDKILQLE